MSNKLTKAVRARMRDTGEQYTTARDAVLADRLVLQGRRGREVCGGVYEQCPRCSTDVMNTTEYLTKTGCTRCDALRAN